MDIRTKISVTLPDGLIKALSVDEETVFFTSFINGQLVIEPIDEDEFNNTDDRSLEDSLEDEYEEGYDEGLVEGVLEGYEDGYEKGYYDAMYGNPYNNSYKGRMWKLREDSCKSGCNYRCNCCSRMNTESTKKHKQERAEHEN